MRLSPWRAGCLFVLVAGLGSTRLASTAEPARPGPEDLTKLHRMLRPQPGESRWMEIDWYPSIWEARQKAAAEGKPLFLWAGSGGAPAAGC
jgi:hypothetical protein